MVNPHSFTSGTEKALFRMTAGTCYFPNCETPVITNVNGTPIVGVEIAHIRGAEPGAARYDASMTDEERCDFRNLILLCTSHHKYVDRLAAAEHSVEVLAKWKRDNEPAEGVGIFAPRLTEETHRGGVARRGGNSALGRQYCATSGPARATRPQRSSRRFR
jgi:hypothetical protein